MPRKSLEEMNPAHAAMYMMSGREESDRKARQERKKKLNKRSEVDYNLMCKAQAALNLLEDDK